MICFPNAKINLGLHITERRSDGYHNLESVFYPVPLKDALEVVVSDKTSFTQTGFSLGIATENNLVMKAYVLMSRHHRLPPLAVFLKKAIPTGAGLGGGSADAAFMLKLLNEQCGNEASENKLLEIAEAIGADCPFFIRNTPVLATGTGNIFQPVTLSLKGTAIYIVKPPVSIATKEAYSMVNPHKPEFSLGTLPSIPIHEWRHVLKNDFEPHIFKKYPVIENIKAQLYAKGAMYASMTGSGSAVFGLFSKTIPLTFDGCFVWKGTLV
jgi:4-diphosphocytidyl-2-C-methyl-D-erythritol kinase